MKSLEKLVKWVTFGRVEIIDTSLGDEKKLLNEKGVSDGALSDSSFERVLMEMSVLRNKIFQLKFIIGLLCTSTVVLGVDSLFTDKNPGDCSDAIHQRIRGARKYLYSIVPEIQKTYDMGRSRQPHLPDINFHEMGLDLDKSLSASEKVSWYCFNPPLNPRYDNPMVEQIFENPTGFADIDGNYVVINTTDTKNDPCQFVATIAHESVHIALKEEANHGWNVFVDGLIFHDAESVLKNDPAYALTVPVLWKCDLDNVTFETLNVLGNSDH